jgi:hypothetical protein
MQQAFVIWLGTTIGSHADEYYSHLFARLSAGCLSRQPQDLPRSNPIKALGARTKKALSGELVAEAGQVDTAGEAGRDLGEGSDGD